MPPADKGYVLLSAAFFVYEPRNSSGPSAHRRIGTHPGPSPHPEHHSAALVSENRNASAGRPVAVQPGPCALATPTGAGHDSRGQVDVCRGRPRHRRPSPPKTRSRQTMKTCSIAGCDRKHKALGLCGAHYRRWYVGGSVTAGKPVRFNHSCKTIAEAAAIFWSRVDRNAAGCWNWDGVKPQKEYGRMKIAGKTWLAHRLAWVLTHGDIPPKLWVLHSCDNPSCVNPAHLFLGTPLDNTTDAMEKGRMAIRERHPWTRLTWRSVEEIRAALRAGETQIAVGKRFGVSNSTVSLIARNKAWNHRKDGK